MGASGSKIVLIGGGGHCKSVIDTIQSSRLFSEIVITDNNFGSEKNILGNEIVGSDAVLLQLYEGGYKSAGITVGSITTTKIRRKILERASNIGFDFPKLIDCTSYVSGLSRVGIGTYVGKKAIINGDTEIGEFAIINTGAIVEHECLIGDFAHIAVGATICGGVSIGADVFVGANSTVIQGVKIGMYSIIGAGSVILADVPDNTRVYGLWGVSSKSDRN